MLAEIQRRLPELEPYFTVWDCAVPNSCTLKKPDLLYETWLWYVQIEVDEWGEDHEDESAQHAESAQSDPDKDARCAGIGGACQILVDGSPGVSRSNVRIEECARHEQ